MNTRAVKTKGEDLSIDVALFKHHYAYLLKLLRRLDLRLLLEKEGFDALTANFLETEMTEIDRRWKVMEDQGEKEITQVRFLGQK